MAEDDVVGRKVDVFWPEEEKWFGGTVAERGRRPTSADEEGEIGVGFLIKYDDGDEQWLLRVRGNPLVRFLVPSSLIGLGLPGSPLGSPLGSPNTPGEEGGVGSQENLKPAFQMDTFSSMLPDYTNVEAEKVKEAFMPMNFHTLSKLPTRIEPQAVLAAKQEALVQNLSGLQKPAPEHKALTRHGLFQTFEYMPSSYTRQADMARQERLLTEMKMYEVSKKPFIPTSSGRIFKYESAFDRFESGFPYMGDPYEGAKVQSTRMKWLSDTRTLHGPFVPTGKATTLADEMPTRALLPDIVRQIHKTLREDWSTCNFSVMVNQEDAVIIRFEARSVDSFKALNAYMNTMMRDHSQALPSSRWYNRYKLRRIVEHWARDDGDGYIYFAVRPPWVKVSPLASFMTLRPESHVATPPLLPSAISGNSAPSSVPAVTSLATEASDM